MMIDDARTDDDAARGSARNTITHYWWCDARDKVRRLCARTARCADMPAPRHAHAMLTIYLKDADAKDKEMMIWWRQVSVSQTCSPKVSPKCKAGFKD